MSTQSANCPYCVSGKITWLPTANPESKVMWFFCEGCGRVFSVQQAAETLRPN